MKKSIHSHCYLFICLFFLAVSLSFSPNVMAADTSYSSVSEDNPTITIIENEDGTLTCQGSITEAEFRQKKGSTYRFFNTYDTAPTTDDTGYFKSQLTGKALEIYIALENTPLSYEKNGCTITKTLSSGEKMETVMREYASIYDVAMYAYEYDHLDQLYWLSENKIIYARSSKDNILSMYFSYGVSEYYRDNPSLETQAKATIASVVATARTKTTRYDKLEYLNTWLCDNCTYDYDALYEPEGTEISYYAHTAMGCLLRKKGVCETYAKTLKLLCQELNIPCLVVNSSTHAFNYVKMNDGKWYMIDATWNDVIDDSSYYKRYFLVSNNPYIDKTHQTCTPLSYPLTATSAYVVNSDGDTDSEKDPVVDPGTDPDDDPVIDPGTDPDDDPVIDPGTDPDDDPVVDPGTDPDDDPIVDPGTDPGDDPNQDITPPEPVRYPTDVVLSSTSYTYDGKVKTPSVTVLDNYKKKISSTYYTVKYSGGRKNVGKYKIIVTFRDIYQSYGSHTLTFTINPPKTNIRSISARKKGFAVKWSKKSTQVTGYQIQYSTSSSFKSGVKTVTVKSYKTVSKTISKLKAKKKYYMRIRTYKNISSSSRLYSGWSAKKSVKTK